MNEWSMKTTVPSWQSYHYRPRNVKPPSAVVTRYRGDDRVLVEVANIPSSGVLHSTRDLFLSFRAGWWMVFVAGIVVMLCKKHHSPSCRLTMNCHLRISLKIFLSILNWISLQLWQLLSHGMIWWYQNGSSVCRAWSHTRTQVSEVTWPWRTFLCKARRLYASLTGKLWSKNVSLHSTSAS